MSIPLLRLFTYLMNKMKHTYSAQILISFLIIISIFSTLFLVKDNLITQRNWLPVYYKKYLTNLLENIESIKLDPDLECQRIKKEKIIFQRGMIHYNFNCAEFPLFYQIPTKKLVRTVDFNQFIELNKIKVIINNIEDLPETTPENPEIVIITQAIDSKLPKDFYGVIITSEPFQLGLGNKIYGAIYSPYNLDKNTSRYITFDRNVITHLNQKYSQWQYLPYSRNILTDVK